MKRIRCYNCMKVYEGDEELCPLCGYIQTSDPKEIRYLRPGTILQERYVIGTVEGAGGFGIVYRAWDNNLGKMMAIKEYFPASLVQRDLKDSNRVVVFAAKRAQEYEKGLKRFLEEARNMAKFSEHKSIVNVFNSFEENGTAYIVMEFLDGVSYKEYIKNNAGMISEEKAIEITLSVLDALRDIHKKGIIHRDIAPDNIKILQDGTVKLMDFGAARFAKGEDDVDLTVIVKPGFAPLEQYQREKKQGPYTDIYAVGAMLYRALTGVMPEEATDRKTEDGLIPPKELNPDISEKLNNIILRAMAMRPELRFQNVDELREALIGDKNIRNVEQENKRRKLLRAVGIAGILVVILTLGGIGGMIYGRQRAEVVLKEASLKMWVTYSEDSLARTYMRGEGDEQEEILVKADDAKDAEIRYQNIIEGFRKEYPQIKIELSVFEEGEYAEKLQAVYGTKDMPNIYVTTDSALLDSNSAADLSKIWNWMDADSCYGLSEYRKKDESTYRLPVAFERPAIYVNTYLEPNYVEGSADLNSDPYTAESGSLGMFCDGSREHIYASTRNYADVQRHLSGKYTVYTAGSAVDARFCLYFSISKQASREQLNAEYQFMAYLLSEEAQYNLTVQKELDENYILMNKDELLPLNKNTYKLYLETNNELTCLGDGSESIVIGE